MVNLLQYSCLGNPMDRGAWRATVHRVTKSQTQLKPLSTTVLYFVRSGPVPILCATDSSHFSSPGSPAEDRRCSFFFWGGVVPGHLGLDFPAADQMAGVRESRSSRWQSSEGIFGKEEGQSLRLGNGPK